MLDPATEFILRDMYALFEVRAYISRDFMCHAWLLECSRDLDYLENRIEYWADKEVQDLRGNNEVDVEYDKERKVIMFDDNTAMIQYEINRIIDA